MTEPNASKQPQRLMALRRVGVKAFAALLVAIGVGLGLLMAVAIVTEWMLGDFFAVAVALLVVVFAYKLTELGLDVWAGRRRNPTPPPPDPVLEAWSKGRPPRASVAYTDLKAIKRIGAARAAADR